MIYSTIFRYKLKTLLYRQLPQLNACGKIEMIFCMERNIYMNFTTLKYFLVTAKELNITHAADKLYISQQALSGHINKLEKELGTPLFERTPNLTLTYAGKQLVDYASKIVNLEHQIIETTRDIGNEETGELRLGVSHTCGRAVLPYVLPEFKKNHPKYEISLLEGNTAELEESLKNGELDLILGFAPFIKDGIESITLIEEHLLLVVPKHLITAKYGEKAEKIVERAKDHLDIRLFEDMPFIMLKKGNRTRTQFETYAGSVGFTPKIVLEIENIETAYALSQKGMGITPYPELFYFSIPHLKNATEEVEVFMIKDKKAVEKLEIGWLKSHYISKGMSDFIELCKKSSALLP